MADQQTIVFSGGGNVSFAVHVEGLRDIIKVLDKGDAESTKEVYGAIGRAGSRVVASARANAQSIADDGTFASGMKIKKRVNGFVLSNTTEAAAVKEFASRGARTISSKGTPLANARLKKKSGVGVPRRANKPRAMVPAVNDNIKYTEDMVTQALSAYYKRVGLNG